MAEQQLFGTSTKKYSLSQIVGKPQVVPKTAQEINSLIGTVAKTADDYNKIVEDEQSYSLNKQYNQIQIEYNDAMTASNGDLQKQTKAYDTYLTKTKSLMGDPEVDEKVRTRFSAVAINDISRIRGRHDAIRHEYNKNRFYDKVATDAITFKSLPTDKKTEWYKWKLELGKLQGLTPQETSEQVVKAMVNTDKAFISASETTLSQLESMKQDLVSLSKVDDKLKGKKYYSDAVDTMEWYINKKKGLIDKTLYTQVVSDRFSAKEKYKFIDNAPVSKERKQQLVNVVKEQEYTAKLNNTASSTKALIRDYEVPLKVANQAIDNRQNLDPTYTKEQAKLDKVIARDIRSRKQNIGNTGVSNDLVKQAKVFIGSLKSIGQYADPKTVIAYASLLPYSASNETFVRHNSVGWDIQNSGLVPPFDELKKTGKLYDVDADWYKQEVTKYLNNKAQSLLQQGDDSSIATLAGMVNSTRQVGNLPTLINGLLDKPDITKAHGITELSSNVDKVDKLLQYQPNMTDKILGSNKEKFYMYKAMMLSTSEDGNRLTAQEIKKVNDILTNKDAYNLKPSQKAIAGKYFDKNYVRAGQTPQQQMADQLMFYDLKRAGVANDEALQQINDRYKIVVGDNYSLSGVDPTDPSYNDIQDTLEYLSSDVLHVDKDTFYTIDPQSQRLFIGTKEMPGQTNTFIPIKTLRKADGSIDELGLNDIVSFVKIYNREESALQFASTTLGHTTNQIKEKLLYPIGKFLIEDVGNGIKQNLKGNFGYFNKIVESGKTWLELPTTLRDKFLKEMSSIINENGIVKFISILNRAIHNTPRKITLRRPDGR